MLPLTPTPDVPDRDARTVDLFTEQGQRVLDALGSEAARTLVAELEEKPDTTSGLAERTDMTLQNVAYHLERLEAVDLVEAVDTHYSSRGREMDVYALVHAPLVLVGGDADAQEVVSNHVGADAPAEGADSEG